MLSVAVTVVPAESVTVTSRGCVPSAVPGVPEIMPLRCNVSPAGAVPAANDQMYGLTPAAAVKRTEQGTPAVACGSVLAVVITSGATLTTSVRPRLTRPFHHHRA